MKTAEDLLDEKGRELYSVAADTTIIDALKTMVDHRIGAILVADEGKIVGIWTERDLMRNTVTPGFDAAKARVRDHMVTNLKTAPHDDSIYRLLDKFLGRRLRHLLVEKDGEYIGILSTGDVVKACLNEKTLELADLNKMVSWEYYENWSWKKQ